MADAAQAAADAGVVPVKVTEFSPKKKGTVIRTEPPAGTKLKAGDKVKIVVSGGFPELTYDDGKNILLANGANGKRFPAVAKGPTEDTDPTFSADGDADRLRRQSTGLPQGPLEEGLHRGAAHRARRQVQRPRMGADGQRQPDRDAPRQEPKGGKHKDQDLCLLQVSKDPQAPQCKSEPDFNVEKTVRWAPDGKSIFALGVKSDAAGQPTAFGIVRWTSKKPFSA